MDRKIITPAEIGEWMSFDQCDRFFKHSIDEVEHSESHSANEYTESFTALNLLLSEAGNEFEENIKNRLENTTDELIDLERDEDEFVEDHDEMFNLITKSVSKTPRDKPIVVFQPTLTGEIGVWDVGGHADFVLIWSTEDGAEVRTVDAKATSEQKSYHQIQAATYTKLIEDVVAKREDVDSDQVNYSAGVITRESEYEPPLPDIVPEFDYQSRVADVTRLLSSGGKVDESTSNRLETAQHQIDTKCSQCPYNESCATEAFEQWSVRLLGLSESEQQILENHGISTISQLADLCAAPKEEDDEWDPTTPKRARLERPEYSVLKSKPGVGEKLPELVYRAQALELMLEDPEATQVAKWIPGSGVCQIPEDEPYNENYVDFEPNSMIRVYLNVQNDPLRDKIIQLSARVSCSKDSIESVRVSELSNSAPTQPEKAERVEQQLFEKFISSLNSAIETVARQIQFEHGNGQDHPLLHFYTYTTNEYDELKKGLDRHSTELIDAFIDTLEGKSGVDTPRVSHLKNEVQNRLVITSPSYGLLHVYDEVYPPQDEYRKPQHPDSWQYDPPQDDIPSVDIRNIFRRRLFDTDVKWSMPNGDRSVQPDQYPDRGNSGLKTRFRYGAGIPLGYLWSAVDRINDQWIDNLSIDIEDKPRIRHDINSYRFHDPSERDVRITTQAVVELGKHITDVLEHIERSLIYRSEKITERKEEFDPDELHTDTHSTPTIAEAAKEYLSIEHTSQQQETYQLYQKLPRQRMLSGESLPVKVKSVDEDGGDGLSIVVEAELPYDHPNLFDDNDDEVKLVCKRKGKEQTSSGDWMVANPYSPGQISEDITKPYQIEMGVQAKIRQIDLKQDKIVFELRNMYSSPGEFDCHHRDYTLNESEANDDDWKTYIGRNEWLILDPATVSFPADRAKKALDNADKNSLHTTLEKIRWGDTDALDETIFDENEMAEFAEWVSDNISPSTFPNERQTEFITAAKQIALLQGPPGTGKTAGTLAPTLCSRIYSAEKSNESLSGLITAPSNTAIDELFEDVADLVETLSEMDGNSISSDNIDLVRITGEKTSDERDYISYLHYTNDDDQRELKNIHNSILDATGGSLASASVDSNESQAKIGSFGEDEQNGEEKQKHTLIFSTPTSSWGLLKHFADGNADPDEIATQSLWDLIVADEASMLTMPKLILAGVAMREDAQVLLGGDHRQLPPVEKHDWDQEKRRSVVEAAPFLSALDYLRYLRGDEDMLDEDMLERVKSTRVTDENDIPLIQLNTTFRFGPDTADFIGDVMYSKDDIEYTATKNNDQPKLHTSDSDAVSSVYDPEPVTLITYDSDREFQQVNIIEATIVNILLRNHTHNTTAGVTTPHNSQRSRLREVLSVLESKQDNSPINLDNGTQIETVNRFQGGQKDIMIVSGTASDPQFIRSESDFLLDETRANVALTRHKHKLVVVTAKSLLSHIPDDPETYDNALLWKSLSEATGESPCVDQPPAWSGSLKDFTSPNIPPNEELAENTTVEVYHLSECKL